MLRFVSGGGLGSVVSFTTVTSLTNDRLTRRTSWELGLPLGAGDSEHMVKVAHKQILRIPFVVGCCHIL